MGVEFPPSGGRGATATLDAVTHVTLKMGLDANSVRARASQGVMQMAPR